MKDPWVVEVETRIARFAKRYGTTYRRSEREISASFEIGCFHALVAFYKESCAVRPRNLTAGEYRYLTTPSGNPKNFSFVSLKRGRSEFELRQQVRVRSHLDDDIAFTPDLVVIPAGANIASERDSDYASGKRSFFSVRSQDVIAAHECKSMNAFPELLIGFLGTLIAAHVWLDSASDRRKLDPDGIHLAPTLFVGGTARALHSRMVAALMKSYPINIILGMHSGVWRLSKSARRINRLVTTPTRNP